MSEIQQSILQTPESRSMFLQDIEELCLAGKTFNIDALQAFTAKYSKMVRQGPTIRSSEGDIIAETKLTSLSAFTIFQNIELMQEIKAEANEWARYNKIERQTPTQTTKEEVPLPKITLPQEVIRLLSDPKYIINDSGTIIDILNKIKEEEIRLSTDVNGTFAPTQNLIYLLQIGNIIGSEQLTTLNLPNTVREVSCSGCTDLTKLTAPNATRVNCSECTSLTQLNVRNATEVRCSECTSLTQLDAPVATKVYCCDCTSLTQLTAPVATKVYCCDCTGLTQLNVLNATEVYCFGCTSLTQLTAPNATEVHCSRCTGLTQFDAPSATIVDCNGCTSLTQLTAPVATEVYCSRCTGLTQLTAPNATEVHCSRCTGLPRATIETLRDRGALVGFYPTNEARAL